MTRLPEFLSLLSKRQRKTFVLLQLLHSTVALIQVAGVVSLAPWLAILSNPEIIQRNAIVAAVYTWMGFQTNSQFLAAMAFAVMATIFGANLLSGLSLWVTNRFSVEIGRCLQDEVFAAYLADRTQTHGAVSSATLISMITQDIPRFIYNVLMPLPTLISQIVVILCLMLGVLYFDWRVAAVATLVVGTAYLFLYLWMRKALPAFGYLVMRVNRLRHRLLQESVFGIKEIRIYAMENDYARRVGDCNSKTLNASATVAIAGDLPRYVVETFGMCALLGFAVYELSSGNRNEELVATLGLYGLVGYKLIPAAQSVFKSVSQMRSNADVADSIMPRIKAGRFALAERRLSERGESQSSFSVGPGDIEFRNVRYRYPGSESDAVVGANFRIDRNSLVAIVGASGAGKSTLADLLLGLLSPSEGEICIGGTPVTAANIRSWQRRLGYVPQNIFVVDDSIAANISFGSETMDLAAVERAGQAAEVDHFVRQLPDGYQHVVGERGGRLSGGQVQRIGIARALYRDVDYLIMDEATSALDSYTEREVLRMLGELKHAKTIIVIAHRLSTIEAADKVVFVDKGRVVASGHLEEVSQSCRAFREVVLALQEE